MFVTFLCPVGSAVRSRHLGLEIVTGDDDVENLALKFGLLTGQHLSKENRDTSKNRYFSPTTSFLARACVGTLALLTQLSLISSANSGLSSALKSYHLTVLDHYSCVCQTLSRLLSTIGE